jgi:hypothetical protein
MTRILIADEHDGTREILRVLLQQHPGWEVCGEASTNAEVLQKAIELKPGGAGKGLGYARHRQRGTDAGRFSKLYPISPL